jgi:hypothetical protein
MVAFIDDHRAQFGVEPIAPYVTVTGIDYENTTKFLLSILWRAHVADHEVLRAVDLGSEADRIRDIVNATVGTIGTVPYPVFCYALRNHAGRLATQLVLTPIATEADDGERSFYIVLLGCAWQIFTHSQAMGMPASCALEPDGTIVMPVVTDTEFPAIRRVLMKDTPTTLKR